MHCENKMRTQGTIVYLSLMRDVRDGFLNKAIQPLESTVDLENHFLSTDLAYLDERKCIHSV